MNNIKLFLKNHQQQIVLVIGYVVVASLAFGLGKYSNKPVQDAIIQVANPQSNYSPNISSTQTTEATTSSTSSTLNCEGKIKGSSSHIYHIPGGSFYKKTTKPIQCFNTEAEAKAAGFRKSSR